MLPCGRSIPLCRAVGRALFPGCSSFAPGDFYIYLLPYRSRWIDIIYISDSFQAQGLNSRIPLVLDIKAMKWLNCTGFWF